MQPTGRFPPQCGVCVSCHKTPHFVARGEAKRMQPARLANAWIGKSACRLTVRRNHPGQVAISPQRQKPGGRGLGKFIVIERAVVARNAIKPPVRGAERPSKSQQVGFFSDGVGADENPLGPRPNGLCAVLSGRDHPSWQQIAQAIQLRAGGRACSRRVAGWIRCAPRYAGGAAQPICYAGATRRRPATTTPRHLRPHPASRAALPRLFPMAPLSGSKAGNRRFHDRIVTDAIWNGKIVCMLGRSAACAGSGGLPD